MTDAIIWETNDGQTNGYAADGSEIWISERVTYRAGWRAESNVRTWTVSDADNEIVATGTADGLRNAKRDALAALHRPSTDGVASCDMMG